MTGVTEMNVVEREVPLFLLLVENYLANAPCVVRFIEVMTFFPHPTMCV